MSNRRRGSFRGRLLGALVGVSVGGTILVVAIVLGFARVTAKGAALEELRNNASVLAQLGDERLPQNLGNLRRLLDVESAGVFLILPNGTIAGSGDTTSATTARVQPLPAGLEPQDVDLVALKAGSVHSGSRGSLIFVAQPLAENPNGSTPVVVVSTTISPAPLGRLGPFLLVAVAASFGAAALVSTLLARRLMRPISAMERAAHAIALGDFTTRVAQSHSADDELTSLATAMDTMARELEDARGRERAFLLNISHDLRTPLTSIQGYAEAIAEGTIDDDASRARAVSVILGESKRLERLVADLLDLARIDTRQFSLRTQIVDASAVVAQVAQGFRPAATEAGLSISVDAPSPAPALLDPERLGQIVANLIENAWKYAKSSIVVSVHSHDSKVEIAVTDDGPGIDPDDLPHIFERLYSSRKEPGRKVGTGLGLAIVRELVIAMDGRVRAIAAEGGGARMIVQFRHHAGLRRGTQGGAERKPSRVRRSAGSSK